MNIPQMVKDGADITIALIPHLRSTFLICFFAVYILGIGMVYRKMLSPSCYKLFTSLAFCVIG